jgi:hypothetical protein
MKNEQNPINDKHFATMNNEQNPINNRHVATMSKNGSTIDMTQQPADIPFILQ